jgi:hypothetical protein
VINPILCTILQDLKGSRIRKMETTPALTIVVAILFPILFALIGLPLIYCLCCRSDTWKCCRKKAPATHEYDPAPTSTLLQQHRQSYTSSQSTTSSQSVPLKSINIQPVTYRHSISVPAPPRGTHYPTWRSEQAISVGGGYGTNSTPTVSQRNSVIGFRPLSEISTTRPENKVPRRPPIPPELMDNFQVSPVD